MITQRRMKDLGAFKTGLTYSPNDLTSMDEGVLVLRSSNIQEGKIVFDDNVYINCALSDEQKVKKDDILICSRNGSAKLVGKSAIIPDNIDASWGAFMMLFRSYGSNSRYLNYLFSSQIENYKGMFSTSTINQLTNSMLGNMFVVYEDDASEQQAIADYLDEKTAEIDKQVELLDLKQKAYQKLKASLINQVVTRGLNPNTPLRDSEIDWIGEIPAHWEVKRIKAIFTECKELSTTGTEDLLSVSEYYGVARRLDVKEDDEYDTRADSLEGYKICKKNDLVINIMLAWKRGLGFSDFDGIVSPAYAVYRGKGVIPHYYHYLLRSDRYIAEFKRNSKGIIDSRLRLYSDRFFAIKTIVPPIEEQQAIANYLDEKTADIDEAITNIDKKIKAYKRLKQSLIDEVVTGKRNIYRV